MTAEHQFKPKAERGFLPAADPMLSLDSDFKALEQLGSELPKLLLASSPRRFLSQLPTLPIAKLNNKAELERAMALYSFIGNAYVWGEQLPATSIPASIAVPWVTLANKLWRAPSLVYASYALNNWRRLDPKLPIQIGNICLLHNFWGGIDEEWFVLIHVDIEANAAPGLAVLEDIQAAAQLKDEATLLAKLKILAAALEAMNRTMDRTPEHCDPYIYYNRVRPFIHGWKNNPALPQGMIYEGVAEYNGKPQQFRGETGSQSSIVPCFDAALGIVQKEDQLSVYLREMREYMPQEHRLFLERLESAPRTRELILQNMSSNSEVRDTFNACVSLIHRFRSTHLNYASEYIDKQTQVDPKNPSKVGTGGTPFMIYLGKHKDGTAEHLL